MHLATLDADGLDARLPQLSALLHACVHDGASIGFILPFDSGDSDAYATTIMYKQLSLP